MATGTVNCLVLSKKDLPDECKTLWVGSKNADLVYGSLCLSDPSPFSKTDAGERSFNLVPIRDPEQHVLRKIIDTTMFPRAKGRGLPFSKMASRGPSFVEKVLIQDLERNDPKALRLPVDSLPQLDLSEVAQHYIDCLTPYYLERLRLVSGALNGATIRLASTCSGLESMPSIVKAIFRQETARVF